MDSTNRRSGGSISRKTRNAMRMMCMVRLMTSFLAFSELTSGTRRSPIARKRRRFGEVTSTLSDDEFKKMFRMTRNSFAELVKRLRPYLTGPMEVETGPVADCENCGGDNCQQNISNSRSAKALSLETKVAIFLRMLAGGSYHDLGLLFGIAECTVYKGFGDCLVAAESALEWATFPNPGDIQEMKKRALGFAWSRKNVNPLPGCVGAVDGIHIRIEKPRKQHGPRLFYSRKGFFSIPVQALVDHKYRFIAGSAVCKGSTHDAAALRLSNIGRFLRNGHLPTGFYLVGDDAYGAICPEQLLTPYRRALASKYELSYNFYQSSHRVHVEQAFGLLVRRWGIFWRPLKFKLKTVSLIVSVAMLMQNFCIDRDGGVEKQEPNLEEKVHAWEDLEK